MIPYFIILIIAIIGALINGVTGFFSWGIVGLVVVMLLSWILTFFSGGLLPRKVRDETATDFISTYPDLIKRAYPSETPYETKRQIASLLENMYKRAISNNPSLNISVSGDPKVFIPSALQVADEQPSETSKELARELVTFVTKHKLWYGHI